MAQFNLPWKQLTEADQPRLVYVLAIRHRDRWADFLVIRRRALHQLHEDHDIGTASGNEGGEAVSLKLRLVFTAHDVRAKGRFRLQPFRNAFTPWPPPES